MQLPPDTVVYSDSLGIAVPAETAHSLLNPIGIWRFEWPQYVVWGVLFVWFMLKARREGKLSFGALLFLSWTTAFWQEFYADWGAYLVYSPKFDQIPWDSPYTTPNKPWYTWAAYGNYYLPIFALMVWAIGRLRKAMPSLALLPAAFLVSTPLFYLFNFGIEGVAVANGWWTYLKSPGPNVKMVGGLNYPLVFPVLPFVVWGALNAAILCLKTEQGVARIEAFEWLQSMPAGPMKEVCRFIVWSVAMNLSYWFLFTLPLILMRVVGIV